MGSEKLYVRGVTYGTFRADEQGNEFPAKERVERDFGLMALHGINAVRTYTAPPRWLLDAAHRHGLRVLVGLAAERDIGYLCDGRGAGLEQRLLPGLRACAGHPAVLGYAVGNEIPGPTIRWLGRRRAERYLDRLCAFVRRSDPGCLVTYVNYPTTEYLELPFVDFLSFNVYLESEARLDAYLARLQNLAGDRPLLMTELGLDSLRHGEDGQARSLDWQIRSSFAAGCAGVFAYAWTDEWHRAGADVEDWAFGITRRDRSPKPALATVERRFREAPLAGAAPWPRVSVVICSFNGSRTLCDCLEGAQKLQYPNFEVIVVDDGSTDATAAIAQEYCCRLVRTENRGLSSARNTGIATATGEFVAFLDDDARPDPHWLSYLVSAFREADYAAVGGPNIAPDGDGWIASCVANAPGGPMHVLISDREAEHIPGCNMAFRKSALEAVGGFDPRFRVAGDDVDLCWRLSDRGLRLGFHAGAMVWHHRRNSLRAYWRQQQGYGKAEALLEDKWPQRYNGAGHTAWAGQIYGSGLTRSLRWGRVHVYQGVWGSAPFQSLYERRPGTFASLALMPEWYLVIAGLGLLSGLGLAWRPLQIAAPLWALSMAVPILQAWHSAGRAPAARAPASWLERLTRRPFTALLHLLQPVARLRGRLRHGLTPWRYRGPGGLALPRRRTLSLWSEHWRSAERRLGALEAELRAGGGVVRSGGEFDRWDLDLRGGLLGGARLRMAVEEHGGGRQMVRLRAWPRCAAGTIALVAVLAGLAAAATRDGSAPAGITLGALALLLASWMVKDCASAMAGMQRAFDRARTEAP
ncbi:MAG TPA: glycosyltransferase [Candidatus Eisenbacteria bacterium]